MGELPDQKRVNVLPKRYPFWVNRMIATVHEIDPEFTTAIEECWRRYLQKGIAQIASAY